MLQLKSITKNYFVADMKIPALKGIDVAFRKNEYVAILGPSGCGKTTLLNIVGGLDSYTSGDLLINGRSTKEFKSRDWDTYRSRRIGFIFQSYNLIQHISVIANVELALTISGISQNEKHERALKALERVGLSEQISKKPNQLSGGQMQRVAIARAIVNNPEIILADEPTGALDSTTSIQVLEILADLAKERLVVMVTHNAELAKRFSTRTIKLLDGEVVSDSNPYNSNDLENDISKQQFDANVTLSENVDLPTEKPLNNIKMKDKVADVAIKRKKKRSSMSIFTAFSLSAKNLITKKFRTILTTIAGSIGIIGIALVLSISNGFSLFMSNLEQTTLSSFPITVSSISVDVSSDAFSSPISEGGEGTYPDTKLVMPYVPKNQMGYVTFRPNYITESYVDYVKQMESEHPEWLASISYARTVQMHLLTNKGTSASPEYSLVDTTSLKATWWQELLSENFLMDEYDLLDGAFPTATNEIVLIVNNKNELTVDTLKTLGYVPKLIAGTSDEYEPYSFSDFIGENGEGGKVFKLIRNNDYYIQNGTNTDDIPLYEELNSSDFATAYENSETELKIVGVIRVKQDAELALLSSGIGYLPSLTEQILADCASSDIVKAQKTTYVDVLGNGLDEFEFDFTAVDSYIAQIEEVDISQLPYFYYNILHFIDEEAYNDLSSRPFTFGELYDDIAQLDETLDDDPTTPIDKMLMPLADYGFNVQMIKNFLNADYVTRMKEIGADTIPTTISIYPASFESKAQIRNFLDSYNDMMQNEIEYIKYNDLASTISASVSQMVNITSYVLIAFAAISLFVSSIMIGIITYISVLERTKEIGILRSLGARKLDISNVFNAETLIIGFASGVVGVLLAVILNFPINMIITNYAGSMVQNLARLNPWHGIGLVALSMVLTVISGLIPASLAAKRDPVVALRA